MIIDLWNDHDSIRYTVHYIGMNHVVELNGKRYIVRRQPQKLILLSFPQLKMLHKCYLNTSFSYVNPSTREIMSIYNNEISILKPVVAPLQLAVTQQSFIDWQPSGGILLESSIVLYGCHGIVFYRRGALLEKAWQIDVLQDIEEIKTNNNDQSIAMKVRTPNNSLFLWRLSEPSVKPTQQIILTQPIVQWQFVRNDLLVILTSSELRIYIQGSQNLFNLYHFYQVDARSFCWVDYPWISRPNRLSVNSLILMHPKGLAKVIELYGLQRRVLESESAEVGAMVLRYKSVSIKRVIGCWQEGERIGLICETKHRELFAFEVSKSLQVISSKAYEQSLGADLKEAYSHQSLILVKDRTLWKYYKMIAPGKFQLLQCLDCDKAFIGSQKRVYYLYQQALYVKQIGGERSEPIPFKYPNPDKVQYLSSSQQSCFLIAGIKFYKINQTAVTPAGFAVKYERAELVGVDRLAQTLTYKLGGQNMLMNYRIEGDKCSASVCKSSEKELIGVKGGRWIEMQSHEFCLGEGQKVLAVFPISKLLKILDSENKLFQYSLHSISGDGLVLLLKNYIFFLQIIQDERGCEIALVKRLNTVLYTRFDPHAHTHKLIDPFCLTFWVGNSVVQMGSKINPHAIYDPYLPPETLLAKQLEMKRVFPPHHPRFIQILIQTNNLTLLLQLLKVIQSWTSKENHSLTDLYKQVGLDFVSDILWGNREEDLSRWPEQRAIDEGEFVGKLAEGILDNIQAIKLKEKAPFILQSILQSFAFYLANSRIVDSFSQGVLILCKSAIMKGKPLSSMHITFLLHSLNKEEAAAQLKPEKMSWDWLRDYSVPFWIDNKEQLKKWIEEIAAQEYRKSKDPFECLFWYLLIGKKTLLITLFKNHRMDSKQHQAIFNFLQRDFNEPKNRSAAVKNAYVLIDKKRYLHSLAFFILGQSIDDCVRLCTDRLKDLNLSYLFVLLFKDVSNQYLFSEMRKGDIWMKHITYKLSSQHIQSYNCLFEESDCSSWSYQPSLTGFHPALIDFAQKLKNSVAVKRQLEIQRYESQSTQDIFADFFGSSEPAAEEPKKPKIELKGDVDQLKPQAVRYYIKQGAPIMALNLSENNQEAKLAYSFELYKLTNEVRPEMEHIVMGLEDKFAIVKCFVANQKYNQLLVYLKNQIQAFKVTLSFVELVQILKTKKHVLGEILHFGYFMEKITLFLNEGKDFGCLAQDFKKITADLRQLSILSKIFACLIMNDYEALIPILQQINHVKLIPMSEIWQRFKTEYDKIIEQRKAKQLKQMDYFQHAFISTYRAVKREDIYRHDLEITSEEAALLVLRVSVLGYLAQRELPLKQEILSLKNYTENYLKSWVPPFKLSNILQEFRVLLKEGTQAKLKLPTLGQVFDTSFTQFFDLMAVVHVGYFQKHTSMVPDEKQKQPQAIQVFRNRQDGVKSFIINKHEGKGLQCIVLLKKLIKHFEVCENLAKRERTKDGYGLYTEDSVFNNMSRVDPSIYLQTKHPAPVQQALNHIIKQRKYLSDKQFPRGCTPCPSNSYIRHIDPPYIDHNQLNSIQCHPFLPFFLIGGKGLVEVAHLNSLKNFDRVKCQGMSQIVKLHSCGQRIGTVDNSGNLGIYNFDPTFHNNCVYSLKKASVIDFSYLNPSVIAVVSSSAVCVYDTLIHPKRQLKFKQPFTKDPIAISSTLDNRIVVLRKSEVLIYDIRMQRLEGSRQLKSKGKSMYLNGSVLYVGQNESKVAVFDINSPSSNYETIRVGSGDEKERERYSIDQICGYDDVTLALNNEGSIYYLPRVDQDSLK